ncbi:MAG: hypothetical protein JSU70_09405 [Phycisphaerales bacterium]|nr:MAG: hypothetical protein JSU70_09405 [Phycisphaerales bacterium]
MEMSGIQGAGKLYDSPNFYRAMFYLCLIVFVIGPVAVFVFRGCLKCEEQQLDGNVAALEAELQSLSEDMVADSNQIETLDALEARVAQSEQVFTEGSDETSLWATQARWSDMGQARVEELWARRRVLEDRRATNRNLIRERTVSLAQLHSKKKQNEYLLQLIDKNSVVLQIGLLFGIAMTVIFAILWCFRIQAKVNGILTKLARG